MKKLIMILALFGALSLVSIASAQFTSSQTWGSFGNSAGEFYGMSGIVTDASGNIYVAELDNRVQKFNENGKYITQFNIPARDIAIDSAGNIYATVNDSVEKFNSAGTLLNTWGSSGTETGHFNFPTGIALDSAGNIYISDMDNNRIQKLNASGNYITSWGTLGSGNGNLKSPAGITVSGNYVYVADMGNYRIQKFDLNGNYISSFGSKGTGDTQFNSSIAVANDSAGNIYVADYYNGRVLEYDSNFNYLNKSTGFNYPTALDIANDSLYILDSGNYRVWKYNKTPTIPVADFTAKQTGSLTVQFNDTSTNSPTSWNWNFGDGINSTEQNPMHTYSVAGRNYTVSLIATNGVGSSGVKSMNITVKAIPSFPNYTNPPTDPNHDGFYEDINGNGILDFDDVVAYYGNMNWIEENATVSLFDYNKNNLIDFDDVVKLYGVIP